MSIVELASPPAYNTGVTPEQAREVQKYFWYDSIFIAEKIIGLLADRNDHFNGEPKDLASVIRQGVTLAMDDREGAQAAFKFWNDGLICGLGYGMESLIDWIYEIKHAEESER
tara:strand:+ start:2711 stop:3049 length:339 start_codon:yes stop_codon:yes gene_type:complete